MLPQQTDTPALIAPARRLGRPAVAGGPDVTSSPHVDEAADLRVLGAAEGVAEGMLGLIEEAASPVATAGSPRPGC
jgi:hypothetical protein